MALVQTVAPTEEPITADFAKNYLRVTTNQDDQLIASIIKAIRRAVEKESLRQLVTATWKLELDEFPDSTIFLPRPPLQSVTSVKYFDSSGTQVTWSSGDYIVDTSSQPGRITPAFSKDFPSAQIRANAVEVIYVAGYGAASAVPEEYVVSMLQWIASLYQNRSAVLTAKTSKEIERGVKVLLGQSAMRYF